jgi:S1-C subfamily serine protease
MSGSWWRTANGGRLSVRVDDAPSGALIAEVDSQASGFGIGRTRRSLVAKIYSQLEYTGFNEDVYRERIQFEYPARPKLVITEEEIKKHEARNNVEGIWSDTQDQYRLGIVPAPDGSGSDYVAVILRSNLPLWQPSEVNTEIRSTASPDVFTCTYFMANEKLIGTTLTVDHNAILHGSVATPKGSIDLRLMRVWPKLGESASAPSATGGASGTAFLLSRSGFVATNRHVVAEGKNFSVAFPGWTGTGSAEVAITDLVNDLAILRLADSTKLAPTCPELPFQLASSNGVILGERVTTIGYPLTSMLGSNPKFSEGVVSSKSGLQDDPRSLQISAQVQPRSSGSPPV